MRSKRFYCSFLQKLQAAGILSFSTGARGRVGAFCVRKKPKEVDGRMQERHRLVLDCRQVNLLFRAPPVTELGSLSAVGDLTIPEGKKLYIAGADIRDCFYACRLLEILREYFCFSNDVTVETAIELSGGNLPQDILEALWSAHVWTCCLWDLHEVSTWFRLCTYRLPLRVCPGASVMSFLMRGRLLTC